MYIVPTTQLRSLPAGLAAVLGPLRAEILATLWQYGRATARDVYRRQHPPRQHPYDTIRRTMRRMAADGYLSRLAHRDGNAHIYVACMSQAELTTELLHQILDRLAADHPTAVATYIARHDAARAPRLRLVWSRDQPRQRAAS